jgi:uncharacterized protein YkwD
VVTLSAQLAARRGPIVAAGGSLLAVGALTALAAVCFPFGSATVLARSVPAAAAGSQSVRSQPAVSLSAASVAPFATDVVRLTNQERVTHGCRPLRVDPILTKVALAHSQDMADHSYFSHDGRNGRTPFERIKVAGYRYSLAGENIAAGQRTPADVVQAWMASPGHRANILNCALLQVGVGFATGGSFGTYWAQDFATMR